MATVPELKAMAKELGITGYSAMRKPELEKAIKDARAAEEKKNALRKNRVRRQNRQAESASNKIDNGDPTPTPTVALTKAQRAAQAGARGVSALPMPMSARIANYVRQSGLPRSYKISSLTPAQRRRTLKKIYKARQR